MRSAECCKVHTKLISVFVFSTFVTLLAIATLLTVGLKGPMEKPAVGLTISESSSSGDAEAASPRRETPNPSKAPWYFGGPQESLVSYNPWFAGVILPSLTIFGLIAVPLAGLLLFAIQFSRGRDTRCTSRLQPNRLIAGVPSCERSTGSSSLVAGTAQKDSAVMGNASRQ